MPFAIVLLLVAGIGFYAFHALRKELVRLEAEDAAKEKRAKADKRRQANTLKQDPKTGVYHLDEE